MLKIVRQVRRLFRRRGSVAGPFGMDIEDSELIFRRRLGRPIEDLTPRAGIEAALAFYAEQRADTAPMDADGDTLLYQWGTYSFSGPETFRLNLTRQFFLWDEDDEEPYQLSLTFHYEPTEALSSLDSGNQWCEEPETVEAFRVFISASPAYNAVADAVPMRVTLEFNYVG